MSKLLRMQEGGAILGQVRRTLYDFVDIGVSPFDIEQEALRLIKELGAEPSFTKVPGYHWATCVNIDSGIVHGIPISTKPFASGNLVTVDVGVYYRGFHTDAAFSKVVGEASPAQKRFLEAGLLTLQNSIQKIAPGVRIGDVSAATEDSLQSYGYYAPRELTGHGVGRQLHEEPMIPNVRADTRGVTPQFVVGQTVAIEIIYTSRKPSLFLEDDGWTISVKDDKLTAVFEETVAVVEDGFSILTSPTLFQVVSSGTISK